MQFLELDERQDGNAIRYELSQITGRTSVPQIWIAGKFVGGCNDGAFSFVFSLFALVVSSGIPSVFCFLSKNRVYCCVPGGRVPVWLGNLPPPARPPCSARDNSTRFVSAWQVCEGLRQHTARGMEGYASRPAPPVVWRKKKKKGKEWRVANGPDAWPRAFAERPHDIVLWHAHTAALHPTLPQSSLLPAPFRTPRTALRHSHHKKICIYQARESSR